MNKLITKARSGVTLVELLVVILIVTILSVSMLPLLQPFVTEAQYAAEAIPVIGNIRTKVAVYQYDKSYLPNYGDKTHVESWLAGEIKDDNGKTTISGDTETFSPTVYTLQAGVDTEGTPENKEQGIAAKPGTKRKGDEEVVNKVSNHICSQLDINYEDLKGRRSRPNHYQYYVISATNNQSYVIGCFGDGNGLKAGTGYAVCELNFKTLQKKFVGTWKRYKPIDDSVQLQFGKNPPSGTGTKLNYCFIPDWATFESTYAIDTTSGEPSIIGTMREAGWEF